ncbi:MAG TPA: DUF4382 domain-containing protein [Steroidobacteraceae bacterium]|nr:DUF4382 domain-containing protein [Steroidobacteraceae bacterium]
MTVLRARPTRRLPGAICALAFGAAAALSSCGGNYNIVYGTAAITVSDVSGTFLSYIVLVDSITLTRNDGFVAQPLASPESVDLTRLHEVSELLAGPALPVGTYTSLSLVVDYTAASIFVDVGGQAQLATALDPNGAAMGLVTFTVTFDPANQLVINGGVSTRLALDFNLAASNTINLGASPLSVTVRPFMTASPAPEDSTRLRARGLLVTTQQPTANAFIMNMRPFVDMVSALGALTVNTSSSTYFNVNGLAYTGAAGLAAMGSLQVSTPVAAYGTLGDLSGITPTFNATAVYAGTSQESLLTDSMRGIVSARSGNALTIHGANCVTRLGAQDYLASATVNLGPNTIVSEDGVNASGLTPQSVSIGQAVTVFGAAVIDALGNCQSPFDATASSVPGQLRLAQTPIWGTLNSATTGSVSLNLISLGDFEPAALNFAGTGTTSANDAVPTSYQVDTGTINESATPAGTLLEVSGIVNAFGAAPPDFTATAVTPGSAVTQELVVEWINGGAATPFSSLSSAGLVVDLTNAHLGTTHYIATGPTQVDITTLTASPTIAFASGFVTLAYGGSGTITVYNSASTFATQLAGALNGSKAAYRLVCVGQYSAATNTFTATGVSVAFES